MKNLMLRYVNDIKNHFASDFEKYSYLYILFLTTALITVNYTFSFEKKIILPFFGTGKGFLIYFMYYAVPYFLAIIPFLMLRKKAILLTQSTFWMKSLVLIAVLAFTASFDFFPLLKRMLSPDSDESKFILKLLSFSKRIVPYFFTIGLLYFLFDKNEKNYYGLRISGINYKPFIVVILFMIPAVGAVSFLPGIRNYYPQFKYWEFHQVYGLNHLEMNFLFLICYIADFVSIELFFRGALVLGMLSVLGKEGVIPAAVLYVVIHFGKPVGETISSFFGAYILSVLSLKYKNISAGILVHAALAFYIEIATIVQHSIQLVN
ncbi:MAG: CPBP family intramembrane glutamic endopeptidase [Bacteroidales bacterium]